MMKDGVVVAMVCEVRTRCRPRGIVKMNEGIYA